MTIPFLGLFKKKSAPAKAAPAPAAPVLAPLEKPSSARLSKTVMPNASRPMNRSDSFESASSFEPNASAATATAVLAPRQSISFGNPSSAPARSNDLPPAVALAIAPRVERTISLELADIVDHLPEGSLRPLEAGESNRRVLFKASELERGMANGRPTVSVASIYEQVPEIFPALERTLG